MKDSKRVWAHCHVCGGEGVTYEEDPRHEGYYLQYLCAECDGAGGRWEDEDTT